MRQQGKRVVQVVTNQWVVPYNPFLLRQFNCHINVEICSSINSIKYITKYVTKGTDQAVFELQRANEEAGNRQVDEVAQFQNARYVGSSEAVWRILEHPISEHLPPVIGLAVHLENGQRVYFNVDNAFFDLCSHDYFAKTLKYHEVPEYYMWDKSHKKWARRKRGEVFEGPHAIWKVPAIGRICSISPRQGDCYYVRLLLTEICDPSSFTALRTVDGQELSFREACLARGLLENDQHLTLLWRRQASASLHQTSGVLWQSSSPPVSLAIHAHSGISSVTSMKTTCSSTVTMLAILILTTTRRSITLHFAPSRTR